MRSTTLLLPLLSALLASASPISFSSPAHAPNSHLVPKAAHAFSAPVCNLAAASMPSDSAATTQLPAPQPTNALFHVAIGRGTQNYTCATNTAASIPVAVGAYAHLYNMSCVAAESPSTFNSLPQQALKIPLGAQILSVVPSGLHYFSNATTPTFDLGVYGFTHAMKENSVAAPASTPASVPWLKLGYEPQQAVGNIREIYRLNTAGGVAPLNCSGQPSEIYVDYAAEYWFWSAPS